MKNRTCITLSEVNELLDFRTENPKLTLRECWIAYNPLTKHRIWIDNTSWNFRMEEFESYKECIRWVKWEVEVY
jgi:hypothetical protein